MKSWKNIANRIPLLVSNLHQNASWMVNDYLEGFSHSEANIQAMGISKKSILLCSRKGKNILNCSYDSGRNSLKIDIFGPGHTLCWYFRDKHLEQELLFHIIFSLIMFANVFPPSLRLSKNLRKRKNIESTRSSLRSKRQLSFHRSLEGLGLLKRRKERKGENEMRKKPKFITGR